MRGPSSKVGRIAIAAATPVAIMAAAALIWQSSYAAFTSTTRNSGNEWATGSVALTDDDAGSARFQVQNMEPNDTDTKCITVTANTTDTGVVKGYAVNPVASPEGLENYVKVTVLYGTGGGFSSCTGFTSEGTLIPTTSLADLSAYNSYETGAGGWTVTAGEHSRTYQVTWTFDTSGLTQSEIDNLQDAQTGIDFQWELRSS